MNSRSAAADAKEWAREGLQPLLDAAENWRERVAPSQSADRMGSPRESILFLLREQPRNGYQIIREITQRSDGRWHPAPSAIYPTLAQLVDEGVLAIEPLDGKKTYVLTEHGHTVAQPLADQPAPWDLGKEEPRSTNAAFTHAASNLAHAAVQVKRTGSQAQVKAATAALDEARRQMYRILAED